MSKTLTDKDLYDLCWLWRVVEFMRERIERVYPAMRMLNYDHAISFYSIAISILYKQSFYFLLKPKTCQVFIGYHYD
ncbi:P22AR C-terminal domain-containing protein [Edwardsiella piscicida]|uniref:P22AR C-terminal domain-containing protein n=1 Tax=Edwardsiella piscicida TaxID=1263550 RepID=UPI0039B78292